MGLFGGSVMGVRSSAGTLPNRGQRLPVMSERFDHLSGWMGPSPGKWPPSFLTYRCGGITSALTLVMGSLFDAILITEADGVHQSYCIASPILDQLGLQSSSRHPASRAKQHLKSSSQVRALCSQTWP